MRIGILQTGDAPDELVSEYGSYADMCRDMLLAVDRGFEFETWRVLDGLLPDNVNRCEGWLITGSKFGVYNPLPWIPPLQAFIRQVAAAEIPLVGICFGHQVIADALGGKAVRSDRGWGLGVDNYEIDTELADLGSESIELSIFHQDQVVELPPDARVYARSDFCPYAGLLIGKRTLTIQAHPEFTPEYSRALLEIRREAYSPPALVEKAMQQLNSHDTRGDARLTAKWIAAFLKGANPQT